MTHEQWLNDLRKRYSRAMKRGDTKTAEGIAQIARKPLVIVPDISDVGYIQGGTIYLKNGSTIAYRETYFEYEQLTALVRQWHEQDAIRTELSRRQLEYNLLLSGYVTETAQ
jgi:hypothetical protein